MCDPDLAAAATNRGNFYDDARQVGWIFTLVHDCGGIPGPQTVAPMPGPPHQSPIVANLLLPPLVFVILYRVPFDAARDGGASAAGFI